MHPGSFGYRGICANNTPPEFDLPSHPAALSLPRDCLPGKYGSMPRREIDWFGDLEGRWKAFGMDLYEELSEMKMGDALGLFPPELEDGQWEWWLAINRSDGGLVLELDPSDLTSEQQLRLLDASWSPRPNDDSLMTAAWDPKPGSKKRKVASTDLAEARDLILRSLRDILNVTRPKDLEIRRGSHQPID